MRTAIVAMTAFALLGCFYEVDDPSIPAENDLVLLEEKLARHPCVGDLSLWERNYRFSRKTGLFSPFSLNPDFNVIEFHLRLAGSIRIEPDKRVMRWSESEDWPDTSSTRTLDGRFSIETATLDVDRCQPILET